MTRRSQSLLLILAMAFVTALAVYLIRAVKEPAPPESEPVPVPVEVATIKPKLFIYHLEALGTVEAVREAEVSAQISGPVARIPESIELGASVKQGDLLAEIEATPFKIEVNYREAHLARAKAGVWAREVEIARQKSLIPINREKLRLARAEQRRLEDLLERELIARQEVEKTELALRRIEEEMERTKSGLQEAEVQLIAAQAEVASTEAELARALDSLANTQVRAPFGGVISEKEVTLGEQVSPAKVLFRLAVLSVVKLLIRVPPDDIDFIRAGMPAEVTVHASIKPFQGKVAYIGPRADEETRSFPVEILIENMGPSQLLLGMFARASIPVRSYPNAILVPRSSVLTISGKTVVFIADTQSRTAYRRSVTIGRIFGSRYLISKGLVPGDLLVVNGQHLLRDKAIIRIVGTRDLNP